MKSMKKLLLAGLVLLASVVGCKMEAEGQQGPQGPKVYKFTSEPRILSDYKSPNNTGSECTYVAFGDWPQTIKADGVIVDENKSRQMGMFTACLGSDGNYYVEAEERAYGSGSEYKYSDRNQVGQNGASKKWFKVEPIVWRVLTEDYKVPGENGEPQSTKKALLLAEKILTGGIKWADSKNNYMESNIRKWLNGNNGDTGFLQTAFTPEVQELITQTTVDNSAQSTSDATGKLAQATKNACKNTTDKIFLLSEQEASMSDYGFAEYDVHVGDERGTQTSTRIRVTTDYAKATGAYQGSIKNSGGYWWLRSPDFLSEVVACHILDDGDASSRTQLLNAYVGVVPALSISLEGN